MVGGRVFGEDRLGLALKGSDGQGLVSSQVKKIEMLVRCHAIVDTKSQSEYLNS